MPLFKKKMLVIQITEQLPGSSLSLAAIEADLLWGLTKVNEHVGLHSRFDGITKVNYLQ